MKPLSVLVAEDVEEMQTVIAQWLRGKGHTVECAASGNQAIAVLRRRAFDLIIADVLMPNGDGLDLVREAKTLRPSARILVVSGGGRFLEAVDCIKWARGLGAHASLLKPFTEQQLVEAMRAAMTWQSTSPWEEPRPVG